MQNIYIIFDKEKVEQERFTDFNALMRAFYKYPDAHWRISGKIKVDPDETGKDGFDGYICDMPTPILYRTVVRYFELNQHLPEALGAEVSFRSIWPQIAASMSALQVPQEPPEPPTEQVQEAQASA